MHGRVIHDVLHLIHQPHRARVAAEQLEREIRPEPFFVQLGNESRAFIDYRAPTIYQRRQIGARFSRPQRPRLCFRGRVPVPTLHPNPFGAGHVQQRSEDRAVTDPKIVPQVFVGQLRRRSQREPVGPLGVIKQVPDV